MNVLPMEKQIQVVNALVEGNSVRATTRVAGVEKRYSPGEFVNARPIPITGEPKPWLISTSHIERQNVTIRMQLRRFTRLTNASSKELESLKAACAPHFAWYNFCRVHASLRVTPAMTAGVTPDIRPLESLLA
jgi:hypothetical protein